MTGGAGRRRRASGWRAASTASASMPSISCCMTRRCATIRRIRPPGGAAPAKPFGLQHHLHDMMQPEMPALIGRLRALADELSRHRAARRGLEPGRRLRPHRALHRRGRGAASGLYAAAVARRRRRGRAARRAGRDRRRAARARGCCWAFSNHDVERAASRWGRRGARRAGPIRPSCGCSWRCCCRCAAALCLYQGEELGLRSAVLDLEQLRDPFGIAYLSGISRPRRQPHAVALARRRRPCRLHHGRALAAGARRIAAQRRRAGGRSRSRRSIPCVVCSPGAARMRRCATAGWSCSICRAAAGLPAPHGEERLLLVFNLGAEPMAAPPEVCGRSTPLDDMIGADADGDVLLAPFGIFVAARRPTAESRQDRLVAAG